MIGINEPDIESFIKKADTPPIEQSTKVRKQPKQDPAKQDRSQGDKTYLLRLPYELWYELKLEALKKGSTLHDYILHTLRIRKG